MPAGHGGRSVQSVLPRASPDAVPFIANIDIEGFERNLFSTNVDWVALFPVVIIELHDWMLPGEGIASNFLRVIAGQERDFIVVGENIACIRNSAGSTPSGECRTV